jgi:hypothetical protein
MVLREDRIIADNLKHRHLCCVKKAGEDDVNYPPASNHSSIGNPPGAKRKFGCGVKWQN